MKCTARIVLALLLTVVLTSASAQIPWHARHWNNWIPYMPGFRSFNCHVTGTRGDLAHALTLAGFDERYISPTIDWKNEQVMFVARRAMHIQLLDVTVARNMVTFSYEVQRDLNRETRSPRMYKLIIPFQKKIVQGKTLVCAERMVPYAVGESTLGAVSTGGFAGGITVIEKKKE